MTAEDKINEAKYNLEELKKGYDEAFEYKLSNFLNSCYSISEHLLEEYNEKYGFNIDFLTIPKFRNIANKQRHKEAIKFIKWYSKIKQKIHKNDDFGFLSVKRRHSVHKKTVKPEIKMYLNDVTVEYVDGSTENIDPNIHWQFFSNNTNKTVLEISGLYLNSLIEMVNDANKLFCPMK